MMKQQLSKLALALGAVVMTGNVMAADNATASVTATVIQPIAVTKDKDMVLGNLVAGNGTVTLRPNGSRTASGTTPLSNSGTAAQAAEFTVSGTGTSTYSISYTDSSTTLSDGTNSMNVTFISDVGTATDKTTGQAGTGTLSNGEQKIYAGAAVVVDAEQAAGTYTGILKVTVAYN